MPFSNKLWKPMGAYEGLSNTVNKFLTRFFVSNRTSYEQMRKRRFDSFRQASTYTPRCNADGSFAKTQCSYESKLERVKCWEVDKLGNPTGVTHKPIIYQSRQQSQRQLTTTFQPITNDTSRPNFSYTLSEPNPSTTIMRKPTSKISTDTSSPVNPNHCYTTA